MTTGTPNDKASHLLSIADLSHEEVMVILDRAARLKAGEDDGDLPRKTLGMMFEKPSLRTRVSFETGMTQLGGHAVFLGPDDIHLGYGEPLKDTARSLSQYVDVIMARVFDHADIVELAEYATVPVINGLTDKAHPCQTLADLLTIKSLFAGFEDIHAVWIGDCNNVARSFIFGCALVNLPLTVATPTSYEPDDDVLSTAAELGTAPTVTNDPAEAIADVDVVYTDVWISMGREHDRDQKIQDFHNFQVNDELLAKSEAKVMHPLPAHRGEEITNSVLESDRSVVFDQIGNRLPAQKALLLELLGE